MWFLSCYSINNNKTIFYYHSRRDDMALYFHPDPSWIQWEITYKSSTAGASLSLLQLQVLPFKNSCLAVSRALLPWCLQGCPVPCDTPVIAGGQQPSQRMAAYLFQCSNTSSNVKLGTGSSIPTWSNWDVYWWPVASNTRYWFTVWGCTIRPGQTEELGREEPAEI